MDASFCVQAVAQAMAVYGTPEIFDPDQGCQFTSAEFAQPLLGKVEQRCNFAGFTEPNSVIAQSCPSIAQLMTKQVFLRNITAIFKRFYAHATLHLSLEKRLFYRF